MHRLTRSNSDSNILNNNIIIPEKKDEIDELVSEFTNIKTNTNTDIFFDAANFILTSDFSQSSGIINSLFNFFRGSAALGALPKNLTTLAKTVQKLTDDEKEEIKPFLLRVYSVLKKMKFNDVQMQRNILQTLTALTNSARYLTNDLIILSNLAELGDLIAQGHENFAKDKLLGIDKGNLVIKTQSTSDEQIEVNERLDVIILSLKDPENLKQISNDQLLQIKLAAGWLMVGYLGQQKNGLDLVEFNFSNLHEINSIIQSMIEEKNKGDEGFASDPSLIAPFAVLSQQIEELYFPGFWANLTEKGNIHITGSN